MSTQNGNGSGTGGELGQALERIIAAFARINTALRSLLERMLRLSESHAASSERSERQYEALRAKIDAQAIKLSEIALLITEARKDITDQVPLYDPKDEPKEKTGPAAAIGRAIDTVAPGWVGWLVKLAVPVAGGFGLDRVLHFLSTGHW